VGKFNPKRLEDILAESGMLSSLTLQELLIEQKKTGQSLRELVLSGKLITEEKLLELLEEKLSIPYVDLFDLQIDQAVATSISPDFVRRNLLFPIEKQEDKLVVATADPTNIIALEDISMAYQRKVELVLATESAILHALNHYRGLQDEKINTENAPADESSNFNSGFLREEESSYHFQSSVEEAPIVKMVNNIIERAVAEKASDIHIEPMEEGLLIRIRVDGNLKKTGSLPLESRSHVISRLKIMAGMDIAEKRLPQDGQFKQTVNGVNINMRASTLPTMHGEKVVLRLLEKERIVLPLESIGFSSKNYQIYKSLLVHSSGVILLTGPTGCGKTTTLYSSLNHIHQLASNIVTVEDPVEYWLEGINQVQVNTQAGLTFAVCLRAILRQDPDVIMVGEMRDRETAEMGTRAAMTGHKVFSTLHTNNAPQAVIRLLEMGVPDFVVAPSLAGVVSQRLVRNICDYCRKEHKPSDRENYFFETAEITPPSRLYIGKGCKRCNAGYKGRTAIHEILPFTPNMRNLISEEVSAERLWEEAKNLGVKTLFADGLLRAAEGITTVEEVVRVAMSEMMEV